MCTIDDYVAFENCALQFNEYCRVRHQLVCVVFRGRFATALMICIRVDNAHVAMALLQHPTLDVLATSSHGVDALQYAHEYERVHLLDHMCHHDPRALHAETRFRLEATVALQESLTDTFYCLRCRVMPRALLVLPCRHVAYCALCAERLDAAKNQCFICAQSVQSVVLIRWTHRVPENANTSTINNTPREVTITIGVDTSADVETAKTATHDNAGLVPFAST